MANRRLIWCCSCAVEVLARPTTGAEVYPHRPDCAALPLWICDGCGNHVSAHYKVSSHRLIGQPMGCIPSPEVRRARKAIHDLIDPHWQAGRISRRDLYAAISRTIGREYHTAEIRSVDEAKAVWRAARQILIDHGVFEEASEKGA